MDIINQVLSVNTATLALTQLLGHDILRGFAASGTSTTLGYIEIGGRIGAIWYLPATFFAVIFVQLLVKYVDRRMYQYVVSIVLAIACYLLARITWLPFSILSAFFAAPFVLLGYDFSYNSGVNCIYRSVPKMLLCLFIFALGVITRKSQIYYVNAGMADLLLSPVCTIAASACVIWISQRLQKSKVLRWIGRNSIYFLCIHLFELNTMGGWFHRLLTSIGIPANVFTLFILKMLFISLSTECILIIKRFMQSIKDKEYCMNYLPKRDPALDLAKAMLIILMMVGHLNIDQQLRKVIYSFHMVAFVFYSGYCFKPESTQNISKSILRLAQRLLVPYTLFGVLYILLTHDGFLAEIKCLIFGVSFTNGILVNVQSVGPVYFILLLFLTRVIYLFIERYSPSETWKAATVIAASLMGQYLGKLGYWLPWSADCAMYALVFYYLGYCFKKYRIMEYLCQRNYCYFLLSCVWAYMIHCGAMEIAVRNYGFYGLTIIGAVSASVLVYTTCRYICSALNAEAANWLCKIGKNTLCILIVHKLLPAKIGRLVSVRFESESIYFAVITILLQVAIGVAIGEVLSFVKRRHLVSAGCR